MSEFNFKSSVCTSREQSERLLALGLKKETADCRHWAYTKDSKGNPIPKRNQRWFTRIGTDESAQVCGFMDTTFIPAWSLHRLIKLAYGNWDEDIVPIYLGNSYDMLIGRIEFQVKQGKFNKEYLV